MAANELKKILIEPSSEEELMMIEAFIKERKLKAFTLEHSKANENDFLNDFVRLIIPIV